ncbi:AAA family ATPase [Gluconobacter japonicus]|uniref:AAA family ATPase n=1 Tax=Gluconobacter japonicus TaxID=376620 RepID=UPI0039ED60F9
MRLLDRNSIPIPPVLLSKQAMVFRQEVRDYLDGGRFDIRPPSVPSIILEDKELYHNLSSMSHGACAYCETPITDLEGVVEQFRPPGGAESGDGTVDFRHYSWIALDWENLYVTCRACSRSKANRFPVRERGDVGDRVHELNNIEGKFLLDPCVSFDCGADHFFIERDGRLRGINERGVVTIDVLHLNRPDLCRERKEVKNKVTAFMLRDDHQSIVTFVDHLFGAHAKFAGIALIALLQQLAANHPLQELKEAPIDRSTIDKITEAAEYELLTPVRRRRRARRSTKSDGLPRRPEQVYYIRSMDIRNFRGITEAKIDFPEQGRSGFSKIGSLVILGENSVGKTSILQALALGALGPTKANELGITSNWCLRDGAVSGEIIVRYFDTDKKNTLHFSRNIDHFYGEDNISTVVLGYGAYRLPARGPVAEDKTRYDYRVHSLFDERKLVNGPFGLHQHLRRSGHVDESRLKDALRTLNSLLLGAAQASISHRDQLVIEDRGREQRLSELSSGYRNMVTVALDIMDVLYQIWQGITSGQALVLIDEIDAHLHPEWRLMVVNALRTAFPACQFLMTTHDPLVLRGLSKDEVMVMRRDFNGRAEIETPRIPKLDVLNIDQLLTSQLFGLESTMDAELAAKLSRYYMLASKQNRSSSEIKEFDFLKESVPAQLPSGSTRRERLMYAVIDRFLARPETTRSVDAWDEDAIETLLSDLENAEREALADDLSTS